ncbi:MAG: putative lipid II flippase FtsW [Acidobacteria bacterium]|nr:MAG: putative lipid II flippase FtsW [Acidobacteriota bacterium]
MERERRTDWFMFAIAAGLALFGTMMVYSASAMIAQRETQGMSQFTYFYKQLGFTVGGIVLMLIVSQIDYRRLENRAVVYSLLGLTAVTLVAVFFFPEINGARRWIRFGAFSIQPSEIAKIALPVFLAYFLVKNQEKVGDLKATVFPCLAVLGILSALIVLEPDLGTTIVLCVIFGAVYFSAGAKLAHFAVVAASAVAAGCALVLFAPWRMERVMAFMDPFKHSDDAGYQVVQSLYAIGSGGVFGEGFAKGQQKLFYLPYPYSDFIFSVVGEELGLIGTLAVVVAFGLLLWRGARASLNATDRFGMLLGIGITTGIVVQALFNISVVISILPAKGIPLPFISYGGSSVLVTLAAAGILISISRGSAISDTPKAPIDTVRRKKARASVN